MTLGASRLIAGLAVVVATAVAYIAAVVLGGWAGIALGNWITS